MARAKRKFPSAMTKADASIRFPACLKGVIPNMERRYRETDSNWIREEFERYQNNRPCGACEGLPPARRGPGGENCGRSMHGQVVQKSIREALDWVNSVPASLSNQKNEIARAILKEIGERLGFLNNVGLEYLSLSRNSGTLSGGESQRIRLAARSVLACKACSMCLMSPPSASTSATTAAF